MRPLLPVAFTSLLGACALATHTQRPSQHAPSTSSTRPEAVPLAMATSAPLRASPAARTLLLDSGAPIWWGSLDDGTRVLLEVEGHYVLLSLPDFRELTRVDQDAPQYLRTRDFSPSSGSQIALIRFEGEPGSGQGRTSAEGLRFTPDGAGLVVPVRSAGAEPVLDPRTRLYRLPSGELVEDLGRAMALGEAADGRLFLLDLEKPELITVAPGPTVRRVPLALPLGTLAGSSKYEASATQSTAAVAHDGSRLALLGKERLYLVTTANGRATPLVGAPPTSAHDSLLPTLMNVKSFFSRDDRLLFGMTPGEGASVWETAAGRLLFAVRRKSVRRQ